MIGGHDIPIHCIYDLEEDIKRIHMNHQEDKPPTKGKLISMQRYTNIT
jgi:hypothetical protein